MNDRLVREWWTVIQETITSSGKHPCGIDLEIIIGSHSSCKLELLCGFPKFELVGHRDGTPESVQRALLSGFMDMAVPGRWIVFGYHLNPVTYDWEPIMHDHLNICNR